MEKERLLLCIERYDHYYDSVNNKSNVFLVLSSFIVGGLIAAYATLVGKVECGFWIYSFFFLLTGLGIAIMSIVILSSMPFIKNSSNSLIYFGSVAHRSYEQFSEESRKRSEDEELEDLRQQVHQLSLGLKGKFEKLHIAGCLFTVQFILFIPFIILVFINLK